LQKYAIGTFQLEANFTNTGFLTGYMNFQRNKHTVSVSHRFSQQISSQVWIAARGSEQTSALSKMLVYRGEATLKCVALQRGEW